MPEFQPIIIISVDPSSTKSGVACFEKASETTPFIELFGSLIDATAMKGSSYDRIRFITDQIEAILNNTICPLKQAHSYTVIALIEVPTGRVHGDRHGGHGAGLSIYGMAVGAVLQLLRMNSVVDQVVCMTTQWTGGFSKDKRLILAKKIMPSFDWATDKGFDVADAAAMVAMALATTFKNGFDPKDQS
jgi:hypothetical protein